MGKPHKAVARNTGKVPRTYSAAEVAELPVQTKIFADGGCEPNPGKAGSGVAVYRDGLVDELWYGLYNPRGTNNTAELNALHQALLMAEKEIESEVTVAIFCDSRYAIQCVTQWAVSWEKKGWKKPGGDIKNLDLIQPAYALFTRLKKSVQVLHVNGHTGLEGNELADRMSIHGIDTKEKAFARYETPESLEAVLAMRRADAPRCRWGGTALRPLSEHREDFRRGLAPVQVLRRKSSGASPPGPCADRPRYSVATGSGIFVICTLQTSQRSPCRT
ncbi:MAG: ribonuclease HI [bacterium]|nr:ribonuclease HI [bacterium]